MSWFAEPQHKNQGVFRFAEKFGFFWFLKSKKKYIQLKYSDKTFITDNTEGIKSVTQK